MRQNSKANFWSLIIFYGRFLRKLKLIKMERNYSMLSDLQIEHIGDIVHYPIKKENEKENGIK